MFGKSHEFIPWEVSVTGPFDQWPTGEGFERFYGVLSAEADNFAPPLHDNTTLVDVPNDPNYYYPTDLADHAVSWIRAQKSMTRTSLSSSTTPRQARMHRAKVSEEEDAKKRTLGAVFTLVSRC